MHSKKIRPVPKKTHKNRKRGVFFVLFLVSLVILLAYNQNIHLNNIFQEKAVELTDSSPSFSYSPFEYTSFFPYNQDIIQASITGIKRMDLQRNIIWDYPYTATYPIMKVQYPYIAVGDLEGNYTCVLNENGFAYDVITKNQLLYFTLNENGFLLTVEQKDTSHILTLYNGEGTKIMERITNFKTDGYPISAALSPDGQKLAAIYIDTNTPIIQSKIIFFHFGTEGQSYIDRIIGSNHYDNVVLGKVSFTQNNSVITIGDHAVHIFSFDHKPEEIWQKEYDETITNAAIDPSGYFPIVLDETKMIFYDQKGNDLFTYESDKKIRYIQALNHSLVLGADRQYICFDYKNHLKWKYNGVMDILNMIPFDNSNKILLVGRDSVEILAR